ncbi:hypothetical protein HDU89_008142 [Geranomyces variabilis]|nr:hypothetical protein HDU89_008142 [Geranomyces variabilis]
MSTTAATVTARSRAIVIGLLLLALALLANANANADDVPRVAARDVSDAMVNHLAAKAINRFRHKDERNAYAEILRRADLNNNGHLERHEVLAMLAKIDEQAKDESDDSPSEKPSTIHYKRALGWGNVADEDMADLIMAYLPHTRLDKISDLAERTLRRPDPMDRVTTGTRSIHIRDEYSNTCDNLEAKLNTYSSESTSTTCRLELQAAVFVCRTHGASLASLECLSTTPSDSLCKCFELANVSPNPKVPLEMRSLSSDLGAVLTPLSAAAAVALVKRVDIPMVNLSPWLQGFSQLSDTASDVGASSRFSPSTISSIVRKVISGTRELYKLGGEAVWRLIVSRGIWPLSATAIGIIGAIVFVVISLLLAIYGQDIMRALNQLFNCDNAVSQDDFSHPVEKLRAAGDMLPMDFHIWRPDEPAPKCSLLVYWSNNCGTMQCSDQGQVIHGNTCKDLFRRGSCACEGLKCKPLCWKVTNGCCCEALKFRDPMPGQLAADSTVEANQLSNFDCARYCVHYPGCTAFSIFPSEKDPSKSMCRLATSATDDLKIEANDAATTFYTKYPEDNLAGGATFADIVQNLKVMFSSKAPGSGAKWDAATKQLTLSLAVMGNCLMRLAEGLPSVVSTMMTDYTNIGTDFDGAVQKLSKFLLIGLAGTSIAQGCAYLDNPDGLQAVAAFNVFTQSRGVNMFQHAADLMDVLQEAGIQPSDGYYNGQPTTGVDISGKMLAVSGDQPADPGPSIDPEGDTDMTDAPVDVPGVNGNYVDAEGAINDYDPNNNFSQRVKALLATIVALVASKLTIGVPVEWTNLMVINNGQADAMVQETSLHVCDFKLTANGQEIVWDALRVLISPHLCRVKERHRILVDGGLSWNNVVRRAISTLSPTYTNFQEQNVIFDEGLVTHNDQDHLGAFLGIFAINDAPNGKKWFPPLVPMTWNNPINVDTRTNQLGITDHNNYVRAVDYYARNGGLANMGRVLQPSNAATRWRDVFTGLGFAAPTDPWANANAVINPDVNGRAGKFFPVNLYKLYYRSRASCTLYPGFSGANRAPGASFAALTSQTTSIRWPPLNQLRGIFQRSSFGGSAVDNVRTNNLPQRRGFNGTSSELDRREIAEILSTCDEEGFCPVEDEYGRTTNVSAIDLIRREKSTDSLEISELRNYISVVTTVEHNGVRLLLTGDAIFQSFEKAGAAIKDAHLVKTAHHGSATTGGRNDVSGFVNADVFVISGRYWLDSNRAEGGQPYYVKYVLWIIQEHFKVRPGNTLRLYITGVPNDSLLDNLQWRRLKYTTGFRPQDCNYRIYKTSGQGQSFRFRTKSSISLPGAGPITRYVGGAVPISWFGKPGQGACNTAFDDTSSPA